MALPAEPLNPAQQAIYDALKATPSERPSFPADVRQRLREQLEEGLDPLVPVLDTVGIDRLFVSKHKVAAIHGCEVRFLAEDEAGFDGWTVPRARGTVAHRAIELSMHIRGEPVPAALVDHAIAALTEAETTGLAEWLQGMTELERADLRGSAIEKVCAFLETWPPLDPRWRPRSESKVRVDLCGERITLQGKVDLTLGVADGNRAGKVLVDLKTGAVVGHHVDDLRFYALLEAIKMGVPPRKVATSYLESGELVAEDVTEPKLASAAARVVDAIHRWLALRVGNVEPVAKPGAPCRWCPVFDRCEPGQQYVAALEEW